MPTYEYACKDCGSHLEVVQSFSDDPLTECSHCGGPLRKVFGSIGITFKGSGFYKTDSRDSSGSTKTRSEPKENSSPSSTDTSSSGSNLFDVAGRPTHRHSPRNHRQPAEAHIGRR